MRIEEIFIENFRGYSDRISISFEDLTLLVGKNDVGKSTILEALDIFFNNSNALEKINKDDVNKLNKRNDNLITKIGVTFSDLPHKIIIDETVETTLQSEYLLNKKGFLELIKEYKNAGKPKIKARAVHPTNPKCKDLLHKKNSALKKIIESENIECENMNCNSYMRKAIWDNFNEELCLGEIFIDLEKEGAKQIYEKINRYLPAYCLFKADRANSDKDNEVQDPLNQAVKSILKNEEIQTVLNDVADIVENELRAVADATVEKIREMNPELAEELNPVVPQSDELKWDSVFKNVSITGEDDISLNKRGSGVKRLVLMNFFRAEAERNASDGNHNGIIYAIEEPETSQHADNQRILAQSFYKLSKKNNIQVLLTTHSACLLKEMKLENVWVINKSDGKISVKSAGKSELPYLTVNEINYLALGDATEEYHDELYSLIMVNEWFNDFKNAHEKIDYNQLGKNNKIIPKKKTLTEYIRHQIHHPENKENEHYTREELEESIEEMRTFINIKMSEGNVENE